MIFLPPLFYSLHHTLLKADFKAECLKVEQLIKEFSESWFFSLVVKLDNKMPIMVQVDDASLRTPVDALNHHRSLVAMGT